MVTIGLPFHNNQRTLADTIRSVFAQTVQDWQLLLVDDGSTDDSLHIARSVRDQRVRVLSDGRNLGLAARLNQIVDLAEGTFLARLDADDLMDPQRLARQIDLLQRHPSLDLVDTGLLSIDENDLPTGQRCCHPFHVSGLGLLSGQTPVHASVVARTEWFRRNRYNTSYRRAQDFELWNRAFAEGVLHMRRIPEPLYFVREESFGTYARMRSTHAAKRQILRKHGPQLVGRRRTHLKIATSHFKQAAYYRANKCGMERHLVATRNRRLERSVQEEMHRAIKSVLSTPVPGLELQPQSSQRAQRPSLAR